MSYCVNCGVELSDSLEFCPLCKTEIINPAKPEKRKHEYPYPKRVETLDRQIDKRYLVSISGLIMLIPIIITLFCDIIPGDGISWSLYVAGAMILVFTYAFVPMLFKKDRTALFLVFDVAITAAYIGVIDMLTDGGWYFKLGLPIVIAIGINTVILAALFKSKKFGGFFMQFAMIAFSIGFISLIIDFFVNIYLVRSLVPTWSVYVAVPFWSLGAIALILRKRKNLKEEIRRRFYI